MHPRARADRGATRRKRDALLAFQTFRRRIRRRIIFMPLPTHPSFISSTSVKPIRWDRSRSKRCGAFRSRSSRATMSASWGQSGCGKSTMLNVLGCLDRPTSGRYLLGADDVSQMTDDVAFDVRGARLGFIFQSYNLIQQLTVVENIEVPLYYQGRPEGEPALAERLATARGPGNRLRPQTVRAFGRPAATRRDRARAGERSIGDSRRRTDRQSRFHFRRRKSCVCSTN